MFKCYHGYQLFRKVLHMLINATLRVLWEYYFESVFKGQTKS